MHQPRFLSVNSRLYLISAEYQLGKIVSIAGPYQCISEVDAKPEDFIKSLISQCQTALHTSPVVELEDLPESVKENILNQLKPNSEE